MSKKALILLAISVATGICVLLSSCGDNVVENYNGPISTEATLNVVVRDNSTGEVVNGATVTLLSAPGSKIKSEKTSVRGTVTFENTYVGNQLVLVEYDGYASMVYPTSILRDNPGTGIGENVYIANENTIDVPLYPLTSSLDGILYYSKDGKSSPAGGATVRITLSDYIVKRIDSVKTNAEGKFSFSGLPAVGPEYTLTAMEKTFDGKTYRNTVYTGPRPALTADAAEHITSKFEYTNDITPFIYLGSSPVTVDREGPLVLSFSDDIDASNIVSNPVTVTPHQPIEVTYSGKTLTITPKDEWNRSGGITVTIDGDLLVSVKGNLLGFTETIRVNVLSDDLSQEPVTGLVIDSIPDPKHAYALGVSVPHFNSSLVNLKWNKIGIDGVDEYEVFYKPDGKKAYQPAEIFWISSIDSDDPYMYATVRTNGGETIKDKTNTFVVQAVNGLSRSALDGASVLDVFARPTVKPGFPEKVVTDGYLNYWTSADEYSGNTLTFTGFVDAVNTGAGSGPLPISYALRANVETRQYFYVHFTESMDPASLNASSATWPGASGKPARVTITPTWPDALIPNSVVRFEVVVAAGDPIAVDIDTRYTISGLKSKNGKDFFIEYEGQAPKRIRHTLDFIFRVNR